MNRITLTYFLLACTTLCYSQTFDIPTITNKNLSDFSDKIRSKNDNSIAQIISLISEYNSYPAIDKSGIEYVVFYSDSIFGKIPVRVYIPENYSNLKPSPAILLLHGAEGATRFDFVDTTLMKYVPKDTIDYSHDFFVEYFKKSNDYILIRPIADRESRFLWAVNKSGLSATPTIKSLSDIVVFLKKFLNIDDNRVYAWGHSDGSDGVFSLSVLKPTIFAGFVGYNSTLTQILGQVYLRNMKNKPFYLVHSDLDDIRPIQQTRLQVKTLDSLKVPVQYKEFLGYAHEDKHLNMDAPNARLFIEGLVRNPYPKRIYWESDNDLYSQTDWLRIKSIAKESKPLPWHTNINHKQYNKIKKKYDDYNYYQYTHQSGAIIAEVNDNKFVISASRVDEIEILISPFMVNLQNPVIVEINGRVVFNKKIEADKNFLLSQFDKNHDRKALWVNSITVSTR